MSLAIADIFARLPVFALVLFRLIGLMLTAPLYAGRAVPLRIRGAMVMVLAALMFPLLAPAAPTTVTFGGVLIGGAAELMIGAAIGLSVTVLLMGAGVAGEMVSQQAGFSLGEVIDPMFDLQSSIIGQLYAIVLTWLFLLAGGHRAMMAALLDTFEVIPILSFQPGDSLVLLLIEMLSAAFILGVRLAGPVLIALFLSGTALGFLSRTMPQLNILSVGFTLRALLTLGVAALTLAACQDMMLDALADGLDVVRASFGLPPSHWSISR
jgi:flagellar biosynthetic protein FliR